MEFLRSLLKRRFARAQVATSRNVGCFLRLCLELAKLNYHVVFIRENLEGKTSPIYTRVDKHCSTDNSNSVKLIKSLFTAKVSWQLTEV